MPFENCPICDRHEPRNDLSIPNRTIECDICGLYQMPLSVADNGISDNVFPTRERYRITAYLRNRPPQAIPTPEFLGEEKLIELSETLPRYSVLEKQNSLLRHVEANSDSPGSAVMVVPEFDYPLFWMAGAEEYEYHVQSLFDRGLLEGDSEHLTITYNGWDHLSKLSHSRATSNQAFVAMWFDDSMADAWQSGISPGITDAGFQPRRVDDELHADQIDHRIIRMIRESRFVVADVTGHRPGVYYESGFAFGLGMPVIWTCRNDDRDHIHFDTRQFNHIFWDSPESLREQLSNSIRAIIV